MIKDMMGTRAKMMKKFHDLFWTKTVKIFEKKCLQFRERLL